MISCRQYVKRRQRGHDLLGLDGDGGDAGDEVQEVAGLRRGGRAAACALGLVILLLAVPEKSVVAHFLHMQQAW